MQVFQKTNAFVSIILLESVRLCFPLFVSPRIPNGAQGRFHQVLAREEFPVTYGPFEAFHKKMMGRCATFSNTTRYTRVHVFSQRLGKLFVWAVSILLTFAIYFVNRQQSFKFLGVIGGWV